MTHTIGLFLIQSNYDKGQKDLALKSKIAEMIGGGFAIKVSASESGEEYFSSFAAKVKKYDLDSVICTDQKLLTNVMKSLPDFKPSYMKTGKEKTLSLNDYHGSLVTIEGYKLGREKPLDVLFLNPLQHIHTVPEAPFIFKRFISKITKPNSWFPQTPFTWELANESTIEFLYEQFKQAILISCDIETDEGSPLRTINCSGYCALFPDGSTHAVVISTVTLWGIQWMRKFNALSAPKLFQGGLYDNLYYWRYNSPVYNWLYDTQHLFHSWYSELPKRLDYITAFALRKVRFWKDDGKTGNLMDHYQYNAQDCWATLNSWLSLIQEAPQWAINNYLQEFPLVFPCLYVEADGLAIDRDRFDKSLESVEGKLDEHQKRIAAWINPQFNPGSPDQCKRLLKVLGCADKNGDVKSSDDQALNAAASIHPLNERIISEIQEVRGMRKLKSTYLKWDKFWDGRLHYKINPAGTDTARLACTESSWWTGFQIQNVPRGPEIKCFIRADEGWLLGENDQPQSEARCVGYLSGCSSLIDLVEGPYDYHSWNAEKFFGVPYSSIYDQSKKKTINKDLRDLSKRTNHGANYNMGPDVMLDTMGPKKVAEAKRLLKLPARWTLREVCAFLLKRYADTYPEVKKDWYDWIKRTISITKKLVSPLGWTRQFFDDPMKSKPALNSAVAHSPQNLSVGIINQAFYKVWRESVYGVLRGQLRLKAQIHDSLLYGYRADWVPKLVAEMMTIPVKVKDIKGVERTMTIHPDISCGKVYWSELK